MSTNKNKSWKVFPYKFNLDSKLEDKSDFSINKN
jgi:hypothetical protein